MTRSTTRARRLVEMAEFVLAAGAVPMRDLATHFGVTRMTAYRDVASLEEAGVVYLQRGRAMAGPSSFTETSNAFRGSIHREEKAALGAHAATLVRSGSTVMLDDSTTVFDLVPALAKIAPITVITHSASVATAVAQHPSLHLFVAGGRYRPTFDSYLGPATLRALDALSADVAVMSVTAVHQGVCYHPFEESAQVKQMMMARAQTRVLLVHGGKFGHRATHKVANLADFDHVVIAGQVGDEERAHFPEGGVVELAVPTV